MLKYDSFRPTIKYETTPQRSEYYEKILWKHMDTMDTNIMKVNAKQLPQLNNS